jgi:AraC family transcriptional regulator
VNRITINPPANELGKRHAILWGRGRDRYHVKEFPGPLSIKSVVRGEAVWQTAAGRFPVDSGSYLLLNDRQIYSLTIDSRAPVETFCIFFERGFVEDAWRSTTAPQSRLLDDPNGDRPATVGFFERLRQQDSVVSPIVASMYRDVVRGDTNSTEDRFFALAQRLVSVHGDLTRELGRLPALRQGTRAELYRRVLIAKRLIDDRAADRLTLAEIARSALLSTFHFHRLFTATFGCTPHRYLSEQRLRRAARLLRETEMPVTGVCLESGFESLGSFSSLFRRTFGATPSAFRSNNTFTRREANGKPG